MKKRWLILLILPLVLALLWPWRAPEEPPRPTLAKRMQIGSQKARAAQSGADAKTSLSDLKAALRQMEAKEAS